LGLAVGKLAGSIVLLKELILPCIINGINNNTSKGWQI